jgi:Zn-dependent M28 family amino/carboxypeptidase
VAAAEWAGGQLTNLGYDVHQRTITVGPATSRNVVAERVGRGAGPRGVVIVCAHLDSVNHGGGPSSPAPGADDNASGGAGVLQIARSLRDHANAEDLRFILFGGEEQGLLGSQQYVAGLSSSERGRVRAVINMDMIGCLNSAPPSVLIEGAAVSQRVIDGLVDAAGTYTDLSVETSLNPFASDHVPFIQAGIPAVLTIEGADQANPNDHTGDDLLVNINYDIALEILRMNVAFAALTVGKA